MDNKQINHFHDKSKLNQSSIKRLVYFVENLEDKLSSVKSIHEKLYDLITLVSKTHETIIEELTTIKNVLNQDETQMNQVLINDEKKFQWIDQDVTTHSKFNSTKEFNSKSITNLNSINEEIVSRSSRQTSCSPSSCNSLSTNSSTAENRPSSSASKRSSNLKKSSQTTTRVKSPKSVTFQFDGENQTEQRNEMISNENLNIPITKSNENNQFNSDLIADLFKQHHENVTTKPSIGFKLGNALTNVRIHEIEPENGEYLRLLNISNSDDYDLSGHFLQQNINCVPNCRFRFPFNTIIRAGQTVTVWCGSTKDIEPQPPYIFVWKEQRRWETGPECVTILAKPSGQAIAWARSSHRINTEQSSSDILFVHSKGHVPTSDTSSFTSNSFNRSRLSTFNFIGNTKPPFAHPPNSPIHPDHSGYLNGSRSPIPQRSGVSQLLNRPKSSPFASHIGCKKDLISMDILRKQTNHKPNSVKT